MRCRQPGTLILAWAVLLWIFFAWLFLGAPDPSRGLWWAAASGFVVIGLMAHRRRRWALVASGVVSVAALGYWSPFVAVNAYLYATGDPVYLDSPGTILVVALDAVLFVIPSAVVLSLWFLRWKKTHRQRRA